MKFYQRYIQSRGKGGSAYIAKQLIYYWHKKYPEDKDITSEYRYIRALYILTSKFTSKLGIDTRHWKKSSNWVLQKYVPEKIQLYDILLTMDHPTLSWVTGVEFRDIFSPKMYYDKENNWLPVPSFTQKEFGGEGPYEIEEVQIHKGDVVVDCGANMGLFSILAVKRGAKLAYAFEPVERARKLIAANCVLNNCDDKIIPIQYGLSDKKSIFSFIEANGNIGCSRISLDSTSATTTIECTTIDDWVAENNISHIDFIKADIEGSERDMLNGARQTIKRDHPRLAICTYHLPDDPQVLRDIILNIDPTYHIEQRAMKLYAW